MLAQSQPSRGLAVDAIDELDARAVAATTVGLRAPCIATPGLAGDVDASTIRRASGGASELDQPTVASGAIPRRRALPADDSREDFEVAAPSILGVERSESGSTRLACAVGAVLPQVARIAARRVLLEPEQARRCTRHGVDRARVSAAAALTASRCEAARTPGLDGAHTHRRAS